MNTIILYSSKYGTTKECAEYLSKKINDSVLTEIQHFQGGLDEYDQIIVGSPIYSGKFPKSVVEFLSDNEDLLRKKKYTIFYCGMSEQLFDKAVQKSVPKALQNKSNVVPVGGAYKLESIGFLNRLLLRLTGVKESINQVNKKTLDKIAKTN